MTSQTTTSLVNWISPSTMQALGWSLLHFFWQGTALAALSAAAMAVCRRTQLRYLIGVATLVLMLASPIVTFVSYQQQHENVADLSNLAGVVPHVLTTASSQAGGTYRLHQATVRRSLDPLPFLVEAWLIGVAFLSLRSAGGFLLLSRERRWRSPVVKEHVLAICYELQDRLGLQRAIEYCESGWLQAPAVIGWFRPVVFLPISVVTGLSEEQLHAVIAHELAHIKRFDAFVNVFQVAVETLLFYHPAVWWLNKRIRADREHCCDETAVSVCGNAVEYARALTLMEEWRSAPVLAMAANHGPLTERIVRVLGLKFGTGIRPVGIMGSVLCLTAALIAGNALLGIARPKAALAAHSSQATADSSSPDAAQASTARSASTASKPSAAHARAEEHVPAGSYIDQMKGVGLGDLTIDQLIALKTQDVTPEYVRGLHEQGLHPDVDNVIAMKVQDVTPEYIHDLRAAGLNPDQDQLIGMKVQGVDAEYYRALKQEGIDVDANRLIGLKVQGVTPEYVREMRSAGLSGNADELIGMRVQDVTPAYLKQMRDLGLQPNTNELIGMKVQDVTPEWIRGIQALGFRPSVNELIGMRVQDVTPEYIKALQSAGFKLNINDIIGAKVQDVTPEFIDEAKKHGFKDLTLQKLIQLRQLGILDSKADL
jgi:beta-lactamase regulating signal transducer with metallopeptidase domain